MNQIQLQLTWKWWNVLIMNHNVPIPDILYTHHRKVPLVLILCMRSKRFIGVATVPVMWIALALLTRMSIPPNFSTVCSMADLTASSSCMSTIHGRHFPPAASTEIRWHHPLLNKLLMISGLNVTTTIWKDVTYPKLTFLSSCVDCSR